MKLAKKYLSKLIVMLIVSCMAVSCGDDDEPVTPTPPSTVEDENSPNSSTGESQGNEDKDNISHDPNTYDPQLMNEWWEGDVLSNLDKWYFGPEGKGYKISSKRGKSYGLKYSSFIWNTKNNGQLAIRYSGSNEDVFFNYTIDGSKLNLENPNSGGYIKKLEKMNGSFDPNFDASKPPYANYIKTDNGYYYNITKMQSGCTHAGSTSNSNEKFINFFGENGNLFDTGLRITYYTPSWEGIDNYWNSGTYTLSNSSFYSYKIMAYVNGTRFDTYAGEKFKITTNGNITTYDFYGQDVQLHVTKSR
ncbi:MAG: hypothetical protein K2M31_08965 [Muribaculaceae bacterium]|nr:hypothetical protein [Muribaculaceae bacterium]